MPNYIIYIKISNINCKSENSGKKTKTKLHLVNKEVALILLNKRREGQNFHMVWYIFPNSRGHRCKTYSQEGSE